MTGAPPRPQVEHPSDGPRPRQNRVTPLGDIVADPAARRVAGQPRHPAPGHRRSSATTPESGLDHLRARSTRTGGSRSGRPTTTRSCSSTTRPSRWPPGTGPARCAGDPPTGRSGTRRRPTETPPSAKDLDRTLHAERLVAGTHRRRLHQPGLVGAARRRVRAAWTASRAWCWVTRWSTGRCAGTRRPRPRPDARPGAGDHPADSASRALAGRLSGADRRRRNATRRDQARSTTASGPTSATDG